MNREREASAGIRSGGGEWNTTAVSWSFGLVELPVPMRT